MPVLYYTRKILNYFTIVYGASFLLLGLLKLLSTFETFELNIGGMYLTIPVSNSLFYVLIVNFLGGFSFVYYAISTMKISKLASQKDDTNSNENHVNFKPLSTVATIAGYITLLLSFFQLIQSFVYLDSFSSIIGEYFYLFIACILFFVPQSLFPGTLVILNLLHDNEMTAGNYYSETNTQSADESDDIT